MAKAEQRMERKSVAATLLMQPNACLTCLSAPAVKDDEACLNVDVRSVQAVQAALGQASPCNHAILWIDEAAATGSPSLTISIRLRQSFHHLRLSVPEPSRHLSAREAREAVYIWSSQRKFRCVSNVSKQLLPKLQALAVDAADSCQDQYQLIGTDTGFVLRASGSTRQMQIRVGAANGGLVMYTEDQREEQPFVCLKDAINKLVHYERLRAPSSERSATASSHCRSQPHKHSPSAPRSVRGICSEVLSAQNRAGWPAPCTDTDVISALLRAVHNESEHGWNSAAVSDGSEAMQALLVSSQQVEMALQLCDAALVMYEQATKPMPSGVAVLLALSSSFMQPLPLDMRQRFLRMVVKHLALFPPVEQPIPSRAVPVSDGAGRSGGLLHGPMLRSITEQDEDADQLLSAGPRSSGAHGHGVLQELRPPTIKQRSIAHAMTRAMINERSSEPPGEVGVWERVQPMPSPRIADGHHFHASIQIADEDTRSAPVEGTTSGVLLPFELETSRSITGEVTVPQITSHHLQDLELSGADTSGKNTPESTHVLPGGSPGMATDGSKPAANIPRLALRKITSSYPDQMSSSSRQARRLASDPHGYAAHSQLTSPAQGSSGARDASSPHERRAPARVHLPLVLNHKLLCLAEKDVRTAHDDVELAAVADAQTLVLGSYPGILRLKRSNAAASSHGGHTNRCRSHLNLFSARSHASAANAVPISARSVGGVLIPAEWAPGYSLDMKKVHKVLFSGHLPYRGPCALAAILLALDGAPVHEAAHAPEALQAALYIASALLTTPPPGLVGTDADPSVHQVVVRQVLVRTLLRLCQRRMEQAQTGVGHQRQGQVELWCPVAHSGPGAPGVRDLRIAGSMDPLLSLPAKIALRLAAVQLSESVEQRWEAMSLLQLTSMLIACDCPPELVRGVFSECSGVAEMTASSIVAFGDISTWDISKFRLLDMLLDVLGRMMRSSLLPDEMGARLIALVAARHTFLSLVFSYASIVLFERVHMAEDASSSNEAAQLRLLDFFTSYAQLVNRQPTLPGGGGATEDFACEMPRLSSSNDWPFSTTNTDWNQPQAPPLDTIGRHFGADDVLVERLGMHLPGFSPMHATRADDADGGPRSLTRSGALKVLQPLMDLPLGLIMRVLHTHMNLSASVQLRSLALLREIFSCRGCPFAASERLVEQYIQYHYVMFLKLFLQPRTSNGGSDDARIPSVRSQTSSSRSSLSSACSQQRSLCLAHLHVLAAIASHKQQHVQRHFHRHNIVRFVASELSLEYHHRHQGTRLSVLHGTQTMLSNDSPLSLAVADDEALGNDAAARAGGSAATAPPGPDRMPKERRMSGPTVPPLSISKVQQPASKPTSQPVENLSAAANDSQPGHSAPSKSLERAPMVCDSGSSAMSASLRHMGSSSRHATSESLEGSGARGISFPGQAQSFPAAALGTGRTSAHLSVQLSSSIDGAAARAPAEETAGASGTIAASQRMLRRASKTPPPPIVVPALELRAVYNARGQQPRGELHGSNKGAKVPFLEQAASRQVPERQQRAGAQHPQQARAGSQDGAAGRADPRVAAPAPAQPSTKAVGDERQEESHTRPHTERGSHHTQLSSERGTRQSTSFQGSSSSARAASAQQTSNSTSKDGSHRATPQRLGSPANGVSRLPRTSSGGGIRSPAQGSRSSTPKGRSSSGIPASPKQAPAGGTAVAPPRNASAVAPLSPVQSTLQGVQSKLQGLHLPLAAAGLATSPLHSPSNIPMRSSRSSSTTGAAPRRSTGNDSSSAPIPVATVARRPPAQGPAPAATHGRKPLHARAASNPPAGPVCEARVSRSSQSSTSSRSVLGFVQQRLEAAQAAAVSASPDAPAAPGNPCATPPAATPSGTVAPTPGTSHSTVRSNTPSIDILPPHPCSTGSAGQSLEHSPAMTPPVFADPVMEMMHEQCAVLVPVGLDTTSDSKGSTSDHLIEYTLVYKDIEEKVFLTGDMDEDLDVLELLEERLGMPVRMGGIQGSTLTRTSSSSSSSSSSIACPSPSGRSRRSRRRAAGLGRSRTNSQKSRAVSAALMVSAANTPSATLGSSPVEGIAGGRSAAHWRTQTAPAASCAHMHPGSGSASAAASTALLPGRADSGLVEALPLRVPTRVPKLMLAQVDVVSMRQAQEAELEAMQDESTTLSMPPQIGASFLYSSVPPTPFSAVQPPGYSDSAFEMTGPLSVFEGREIHLEGGAHFKSQRVIAQRKQQQMIEQTEREKERAAMSECAMLDTADVRFLDYETEVEARLLYQDDSVHLTVISLLLNLLLSEDGQLEPVLTQHGHASGTVAPRSSHQDICMILYHHLNHKRNTSLLPSLLQIAHVIGAPAVRLLKLLARPLFNDKLYSARKATVARGAFAYVQQRDIVLGGIGKVSPMSVAEKVIEMPTDMDSQLQVADLLMEVSIMERFHESPQVCKLLDFGVTQQGFKLIMPLYKCTLADWRSRLPTSMNEVLHMQRLFLNVFRLVVDAALVLQSGNVVHFDLKPQNIFLERRDGVSEADFWSPPSEDPPFSVVIGDFGESKMWGPAGGTYTTRPRGTDFMKSPEMLRNGQHFGFRKRRENFDRRQHTGAGPASDVWSLGCLLYQLVFGEMLFFEDYMLFLQRLTIGTGPIFPPTAASKLEHTPAIHRLLQQLLERNVQHRTELDKLAAHLRHLKDGFLERQAVTLPTYTQARVLNSIPSSVPLAGRPGVLPFDVGSWPCAWLCVPRMECTLATAVEAAHRQQVVQFSPGVLFAPGPMCKCASELASYGVSSLVVVASREQSVLPWKDLAATIAVPAFFFMPGKDLATAKQTYAHSLRGLCVDVFPRQHSLGSSVMVVYEQDLWAVGALVAMALSVRTHALSVTAAMVRLWRCTINGRLRQDHLDVLQLATHSGTSAA